jgi:hypothetical protein
MNPAPAPPQVDQWMLTCPVDHLLTALADVATKIVELHTHLHRTGWEVRCVGVLTPLGAVDISGNPLGAPLDSPAMPLRGVQIWPASCLGPKCTKASTPCRVGSGISTKSTSPPPGRFGPSNIIDAEPDHVSHPIRTNTARPHTAVARPARRALAG